MLRLTCLLVLLALTLPGCGVGVQDRPSPIAITPPSDQSASERRQGGALSVPVYFVRGARLEPVQRAAAELSAQTALELLVSGPTRGEVTSGIRTALAPQPLTAMMPDGGSRGTVVVAATSDFASVSGGNQLLAVAQLVWTVTELPAIDRVRITVEGIPVEVPTDNGLSRDAVARSDYMSVAPPPEEPPTPTATPSVPPSTSVAPSEPATPVPSKTTGLPAATTTGQPPASP